MPAVETVDVELDLESAGGPTARRVTSRCSPPTRPPSTWPRRGRIVAGGAGLGGPDRFVQLAAVAAALDASVGATRVVTDRGWLGYDRQIGTTGVAVDPRLYLALGISGAVQHVNGLGDARPRRRGQHRPPLPDDGDGRSGHRLRRQRAARRAGRATAARTVADVDVVVVGAGPAGSAAAITLARAGWDVVLVERGPFPGAKNMYGGVVYGRVLDGLMPEWWEEAPIQRWVTRRSTMMLTGDQALTVDFRTEAWGRPPYNGATALRSDFDAWLAGHAEAAGATLLCSTTVTGLLRDGGRVVGVRTDRPDGDLGARVVIACDGVNSFLAKEAGLYPDADPANFTLGVKEVLALPRDEIDRRFGLTGRDGRRLRDHRRHRRRRRRRLPLHQPRHRGRRRRAAPARPGRAGDRPEEIIAGLKAHPAIAPLVDGGELKEYSAHLIPEGGYDACPSSSGTGCWSRATPPGCAWPPASGSRA